MAGPPPPPPGPEAPRYQEWILDTIDSLRSRKARPDLERICRMVRRRHGPEPERTRAELEKLIQQRAVLRVSYKGSISYRNAARVQPPRRPPHTPPPPPPPPPPPLPPPAPAAAAAAPPPRRSEPPVSLRDAARLLGGDGRLTRGRLQGSAVPVDGAGGGGAGPGGAPPEASSRDEEEEEEEEEEDEDGTGSEASEEGGAPSERLNGEGRGGPPLRPPGQPPPPERPPQPKACAPGGGESGCHQLGPLKKDGTFGQPDRCPPLPPPCPPRVPALRPCPRSAPRRDKLSDPVDWSVRDVVDYFTEAGFPEQATAFQEQEIDGRSLLLMQRSDVLTGLSIRLGPALKIYEHHVKLLQRSHFQEPPEPPPEPFPA
uniref:Uncharacterized protein n=1 Tax=Strigops habroptila TaxID=2489341 RepID=A0A672UCS7_STRHB